VRSYSRNQNDEMTRVCNIVVHIHWYHFN